MTALRYSTSTLYADYGRVVFGLTLTVGPVLLLDVADALALVLLACALLFAWFGVRTAMRQLSWVELSPEAVALCGPVARRLPWHQLERLELAYYAPRRARQDGWLQLSLRGASGPPIRVDSNLSGFDQVLDRARAAARANALELDPTTEANLAALDMGPPQPTGG